MIFYKAFVFYLNVLSCFLKQNVGQHIMYGLYVLRTIGMDLKAVFTMLDTYKFSSQVRILVKLNL